MERQIFSKETMEEARRCVAEHRMLPLCKDIVFKMFLTRGTPESNYCLRKILGAVIGRTVKETTILNPEILPEFIGGKSSRLDVNVTFDDGNKANIELQCAKREDNQILRAIYYACRLMSGSLAKGERYEKMGTAHQIMITDFTVFEDGDIGKSFSHHLMLKNDRNEILTDKLNIYFVELTKLDKIVREKLSGQEGADNLTELEFWSILLKYNHQKEIIEKLSHTNKFKEELSMANSASIQISQDEIDWAYHLSYDRAEVDYQNEMMMGREKAHNEGMAEGQKQGRLEGARDSAERTAVNLIKMKVLSLEQIAQATGLELERVKELSLSKNTNKDSK